MSRQKLHLAHHLNHHSYPWFLERWPALIHWIYRWNRLLLQRNRVARLSVVRELRRIGQGNALDAGCGEGLFILPLARKFPDIHFTGLDKNQSHIDFCNNYRLKIGLNNVSFRQQELTGELPDLQADLVYCIGTLQYIKPDKKLLQHFYQLLPDAGKLIIYIPINGRMILPVYRKYFLQKEHYEKSQNRMRIYSEKEITDKLTAVGFSIFNKKYTYGTMGILGHEIYSVLLIKTGDTKKLPYFYLLLLTAALPLILLLVWGDYLIKKQNGNGLLIVAQKNIL